MDKPKGIKGKETLEYIEYLEKRNSLYENSPYKQSYLALVNQLDHWNRQLVEAQIDIFAESTDKVFQRAHKFFSESKPYFEQLEYLRGLMTAEDIKKVDETRKLGKGSAAERHIFNATPKV